MYIKYLALTNFRNYARLELDLAPGVTLIHGSNACGKTSLLEAIFYLATSRSPHAGADRELVRWGASEEVLPFARVQAETVKRNDTHTEIEIILMPSDEKKIANEESKPNGRVTKRIKVNGIAKRSIDLLGELNAVLFLPEDLDLVFGSPSNRRRYLDTTLAQIDPRYGRALSKYVQVIEQRNSLLRDFRERAYNPHELAIWDRQLIEEGTYLISRRAETINRYNSIVGEIHARLTDEHEQLRLVYQPSVDLAPIASTDTKEQRLSFISHRFTQQLQSLRQRELGAGTTLVGPHRDDVRFLITRNHDAQAMDATTFASRGQGRTVALSLKLGEVALMRAETGEAPVLLLDDVMSELDPARRAALTQVIADASQALVTTADLAEFAPEFVDQVRVLNVCEGKVTRQF